MTSVVVVEDCDYALTSDRGRRGVVMRSVNPEVLAWARDGSVHLWCSCGSTATPRRAPHSVLQFAEEHSGHGELLGKKNNDRLWVELLRSLRPVPEPVKNILEDRAVGLWCACGAKSVARSLVDARGFYASHGAHRVRYRPWSEAPRQRGVGRRKRRFQVVQGGLVNPR